MTGKVKQYPIVEDFSAGRPCFMQEGKRLPLRDAHARILTPKYGELLPTPPPPPPGPDRRLIIAAGLVGFAALLTGILVSWPALLLLLPIAWSSVGYYRSRKGKKGQRIYTNLNHIWDLPDGTEVIIQLRVMGVDGPSPALYGETDCYWTDFYCRHGGGSKHYSHPIALWLQDDGRSRHRLLFSTVGVTSSGLESPYELEPKAQAWALRRGDQIVVEGKLITLGKGQRALGSFIGHHGEPARLRHPYRELIKLNRPGPSLVVPGAEGEIYL